MKNWIEAKLVARIDREREAKVARVKAKGRVLPPADLKRVKTEPIAPASAEVIGRLSYVGRV